MVSSWINLIKNFLTLLIHPNFQSSEGIRLQTELRYGEALELEYYGNPTNWVFLEEEKLLFNDLNQRSHLSILILGCGAGREFSQLLGHDLYGVDTCGPLLRKCQEMFPNIQVSHSLDKLTEVQFDVIYVSHVVYNHIHGQENRLNFLKAALQKLRTGGELYLYIDEFDVNCSFKFKLASGLLKLRWFKSSMKWQVGDTVRAYNGSHNPYGRIFFYHYFKNTSEIMKELNQLNKRLQRHKDYWVIINEDN